MMQNDNKNREVLLNENKHSEGCCGVFFRIVSLLLPITSRAKIRQSGISPLHVAAEHDRRDIIRLLIESGCDVNSRLSEERSLAFPDRRVTALYCAIAARHTQAAAMLLNAGADPNTDPFNPLLLAVRRGCLKTVALLVEHGADVNARLSEPCTDFPGALLYTSHLNVLHYLLDNGCDAQSCFKCHEHHRDDNSPPIHFTPVNTSQTSLVCTKPTVKVLLKYSVLLLIIGGACLCILSDQHERRSL